jgi:hypothetical protein
MRCFGGLVLLRRDGGFVSSSQHALYSLHVTAHFSLGVSFLLVRLPGLGVWGRWC